MSSAARPPAIAIALFVVVSSFASAQPSFSQREVATSLEPSEVEVGDFNKDDRADFATVSPSARVVAVHISNGDGTFRSRVEYLTGGASTHLSVGDVDKD